MPERYHSRTPAAALGELRAVSEALLLTGLRERIEGQEARRQVATLKQQLLYDPLTGLPNRALFADRLAQLLLLAERTRATFALLYLDLDRFKAINDRLGHAMGDLVLRQVAARLAATLRGSDTVARLHGDEFAVLLPGDDAAAVTAVVRKLRRALAPPFALGGAAARSGISIGRAVYPAHGTDAATLLARADAAMYRRKRRSVRDATSPLALRAETAGAPPRGAPAAALACLGCGAADPAALVAYPDHGGDVVALCYRCAHDSARLAELVRALSGDVVTR